MSIQSRRHKRQRTGTDVSDAINLHSPVGKSVDHTAGITNLSPKPTLTPSREDEDWTSSSGSSRSSSPVSSADSDSNSDADSDSDSEVEHEAGPCDPAAAPDQPQTHTNSITSASANATVDPTIHARLTSFFSRLAEQRHHQPDTDVDDRLEHTDGDSHSDSGFEDDVGGGGGAYIELDLALGVLSEHEHEDGQGPADEIKVPPCRGRQPELEHGDDGGEDETSAGAGAGGRATDRLAALTSVAAGRAGLAPELQAEAEGRKRKRRRKIEELE